MKLPLKARFNYTTSTDPEKPCTASVAVRVNSASNFQLKTVFFGENLTNSWGYKTQDGGAREQLFASTAETWHLAHENCVTYLKDEVTKLLAVLAKIELAELTRPDGSGWFDIDTCEDCECFYSLINRSE